MHTKTMEGLVGARTNMDLLNTPMRVFKEARRKGDTATMKRAMGYVDEFSDKAEEYKAEADKGMEEDAKEAREKAKLQREEAIRKRKEERERLEEKIQEDRNADTVTKETKGSLLETKGSLLETDGCLLEISGEGRVLVKENLDMETTGAETDVAKSNSVKEPMTYTKAGETAPVEQKPGISVSV